MTHQLSFNDAGVLLFYFFSLRAALKLAKISVKYTDRRLPFCKPSQADKVKCDKTSPKECTININRRRTQDYYFCFNTALETKATCGGTRNM